MVEQKVHEHNEADESPGGSLTEGGGGGCGATQLQQNGNGSASQTARQHHHHHHHHDVMVHDHEREDSVPPSQRQSRTSPPFSLPHSPRYSTFTHTPCRSRNPSHRESQASGSQQASLTNSYEHNPNPNPSPTAASNANANAGLGGVEQQMQVVESSNSNERDLVGGATRGEQQPQEESELNRLLRAIAERRKHASATSSTGSNSRRRPSGIWNDMPDEGDGEGQGQQLLDEWLGPSTIHRANVPGHAAERYRLAGVQIESIPVDESIEEDPDMKAIVDYFEG